ncbi:tetratricopeptide repeat protein [Spiractinospora alimapuensis]|uniref:tetratricopeptide repeat protein n=1 Tax=Spiractinospora alimapuensis TaxID=2820884 RepID=UPI001F36DD5E|nr:tetratricopeptide repeat protein [Spiractinospora alimapuensis]
MARRSAAVCRLLRCWPAAEYIYQTAIHRGAADAGLHFRLGQVREHRGNPAGALDAYTTAIQLDSSAAIHHFRMGRALEQLDRLAEAEEAYAEALLRDSADTVALRQRAKLREKRKNFQAAAEDYERALELAPHRKDLHLALANALEKACAPLRAVDVYSGLRERFGDDAKVRRKLAIAYDKSGDWQAARDMLSHVIAERPADRDAHYRLAGVIDRLGRIPFVLREGEVLHVTSSEPDDLGSRAMSHFETSLAGQPKKVTWLHRAAARLARRKTLYKVAMRVPIVATRLHRRVSRPETRLRRLYELGQMYERAGKLAEAARHYRSAVAGLESVDAIWVHKAEPAWRFRLAYVETRLGANLAEATADDAAPDADDARLLREAHPDTEASSMLVRGQQPGGFFDATIVDVGLRVEGFLLPTDGDDTVDIHLDGAPVKSVATNPKAWLRPFSFDLSHKVLAQLPTTSRLTLSCGDRPLVSTRGSTVMALTVPDGSSRLPELMDAGYTISKKGVLAAPPEEISDRQLRYLKSYGEAKDKFEEVLGKKLFLLYGTLLGCYRDRAFIAGDDDFDVAYISDATDPVELKSELQDHALALLAAGYDISITVTGRLFKVRLGRTWLDVNALWFYADRAWAFDAHNLKRSQFEPVSTMEFLEHDVYVPREIEAFLSDNYGTDWRTPQPDFRYYRSEEDRRILRRSWLTPSEAREFARLCALEQSRNPRAGTFVGIGDPADTGFSV